MHEAATMRGIVTTVLEKMAEARADRVVEVQLVLGRAGHFTEEAASQYFELMAKDTPAADARLVFSWLPATYQCLVCLTKFDSELSANEVVCPKCQGLAIEVEHTHDCYVTGIEVEMDN
jgi:hydrogenase nickel incorporation protein HypA/HybF